MTLTATATNTAINRIASIDVLRALTMVLMIFVNDLWSLKNIPEWLEHVPADYDGMGLADVVFPAFLFIVGMSMPFAVSARRKKGDSDIQIVGHVLMRALALIVMGLFLVNGEYLNAEATGIHRLLWNCLSCLSFILVWNAYPPTANFWVTRGLKGLGVVILLVLAVICRSGEGENVHGFATYWWGILGLIGWAYLICGIAFTFVGNRLLNVFLLWLLFSMLCVASHSGMFPQGSIMNILLGPLGGGAMPALVMGGVVTSMIYLYYRNTGKHSPMIGALVVLAAVLLIAGFLTRPFWGISKIGATPSWIWICSAITIFTFVCIYWLADIMNKATWFNVIKPAGTNTLLCYLIPYFAYAIVVALKIDFPDVMLTGIFGLIKSFSFALLVVVIAGWLGKLGLQLKL
jgi:heparan-alpha-glucosaminide N-acetyltransferase